MPAVIWFAVAIAAALGSIALAFHLFSTRTTGDDLADRAWREFRGVAEEVGGLVVVRTEDGWPRLAGEIGGVLIEIDCENHVSRGLDGLLGLRCRLPDAISAPNAALWIGDIDALRTQYGRPRPAGDGEGLFDVYTRVEPSASDWWQEGSLHEAMASLPGAGLVLYEGQLTVLFSRLDADSVRTAMRIPSLVQEGVRRVTLH